jgi:hypothetical protein
VCALCAVCAVCVQNGGDMQRLKNEVGRVEIVRDKKLEKVYFRVPNICQVGPHPLRSKQSHMCALLCVRCCVCALLCVCTGTVC